MLRLAVLLACVALATSRLGLLAHELVGHGGTALAVGAHVTGVRLFWFAGGWIHYRLDAPSLAKLLAIAMGGIAVELVCGGALVLAAGARSRLTRGIGAALVVHATFYLASGAWSGFGDGQLLYQVLGDARYAVAIAAGAVTCIAAYLGARSVFGALVATAPNQRVAGALAAIALAAAANAALAIGEVRVRADATYAEVMQPERERIVARDLAAWQGAQGSASGAAIAAERAHLEAEHHAVPFGLILALCAAACAVFGAARSPRGEPLTLSLGRAAMAAGIAVGAVIALSYA